jgi:hypothetical protein
MLEILLTTSVSSIAWVRSSWVTFLKYCREISFQKLSSSLEPWGSLPSFGRLERPGPPPFTRLSSFNKGGLLDSEFGCSYYRADLEWVLAFRGLPFFFFALLLPGEEAAARISLKGHCFSDLILRPRTDVVVVYEFILYRKVSQWMRFEKQQCFLVIGNIQSIELGRQESARI